MALAETYLPYAEKTIYTEAEYFEFERRNFGRWEYVNGEIRAMSGGPADHSTIAGNIIRTLGNALVPKGCRVFGSDMRVRTGNGVNTFPNVSAVCGPLRLHRGRTDTLANPLLIVEVLSASTEPYDRARSFSTIGLSQRSPTNFSSRSTKPAPSFILAGAATGNTAKSPALTPRLPCLRPK